MSIDTGRERIDGGRRRRTVVRLTPAAKPGQGGEQVASSPAQESADQGKSRERKESSGLKEDAKEGARSLSLLLTWLGRLRYYGLALLLVGVAALLHWAMEDILSATPFLVFYLAWVGAAAFGGLGPGLLAAITSWLCIDLLFDPTPFRIGFDTPMSIARILVFLAGGLVISVVGEKMRRARIRERRQTQELAAANAALGESERRLSLAQQIAHVDITERKRAEEALLSERDQARQYLRVAGVMMVALDADGRITLINEKGCEILGYRQEEILGCDWFAVCLPREIREEVTGVFHRLLAGDIAPVEHYENTVLRKDGQPRLVAFHNTVLRDASSRIVGVLFSGEDITERKRMEETLAASERKYRSLVQNIPDVTWTTDREGRTRFISPNVLDVYGYSAEEICAGDNTWLGNVHPDDRARVERAFHERLTQKKRYDIEYRIRRKDGTWIWLHDRSVSSYEKDGQRYADGLFSDITERKHIEEELRQHTEHLEELVEARTHEVQESERRYRSLAENAPDIIQRLDRELRHLYVNPAFERATGLSPHAVIGKTARELGLPQDLIPCWEQAAQRVLRTGESQILVFEMPTPQGRRHYEARLVPEFTPDGSTGYVLAITRDITERKQAEAALRASEEKYHFLVENSKDITGTIDLQGKPTFVSANVEKMTGYRADEFSGKTLWDFLAPECHDLVKENLRRCLRGEDVPPYELLVMGKDGRRIPFEVVMAAIVDDGGKIVGTQGVLRDITERKRADAALLESEKRYRGIVEDQTELICLFEGDGTIMFVNDAYCRYFGKTREELVGHKFLSLIVEEDRESVKARIAALNAEHPLITLEERVRRPDGSIAWQEWKNRAVFDGQGRLTGYQAVGRDITERKRVEEALAESRKKYRGLVEKINNWVWEIDADGVYTYASPRARELLGYAPEEILGKTPFDLMPPAEAQRVRNAFEPIWRGHKPLELLENTLVRKDGSLVTVETSGMPVFAEDGAFLGYMGIDRDVTARQRAEEALRASQSMLQSVLENVPQGVFWKDRHSTYLGCNKVFVKDVGLESARDVIGKTDYDLPWSPEQTASFREYDRRIMENDAPEYHIIEQMREADGRLTWVETNKAPLHDAQGQVIGILGTYEDITERKRAEEALQASEEKYRFLVENSKDVTWMIDLQGRWTFISSNVEKVTGYRADEVIGNTIWDFLAPECRDLVNERLGWCRRGEDVPPYEVLVVGKDGRRTPFELHTAPILDDRGRMVGVQGVSRDITERKKAEEALREWNATLETKVAQRTEELEHRARQLQKLTLELTEAEERERKRLAEILHDDLQQVLAAAKFQVGLLDGRVRNDPESQEIAGQAKDLLVDAIAKSRSLFHELSAPALSQSDLCEVFEGLAEQMQKKHGFTVHLEMGERIEVASEPLRILLYKAAQEALFNAIKHAGVHEAKLRLRHQRGRLRLSVSDEGRGFDPTELGGNFGFGLLSIRERVGYLGGRLKIRSAVGKGSTFLITVPDAEGSP